MKIEVSAHSSAPVERVWALLADARGWPEWTPFDAAELEREGSPVADGVGAIRRFTNGKTVTRECVVAFEPPHWLAYQLLSGLPQTAGRRFAGSRASSRSSPGWGGSCGVASNRSSATSRSGSLGERR
jgi:uncharacterized protein YndB with AHSA1/START domain